MLSVLEQKRLFVTFFGDSFMVCYDAVAKVFCNLYSLARPSERGLVKLHVTLHINCFK